MKRRVVLLGPPGSGKGTLAEKLESEIGIEHVSSGHWFRREMAEETALGRRIEEYIVRGELIPDELVVGLIEVWVTPELLRRGFLLDGFPRTCPQAVALDRYCIAKGAPVEIVLYLQCPDQLILERITGRRVCLSCGKIYHVQSFPPRSPGVCDVCGSPLTQRSDDTEEVVKNRLELYRTSTEPLFDYYLESGRIVSLNATLGSEQAYAAAVRVLES